MSFYAENDHEKMNWWVLKRWSHEFWGPVAQVYTIFLRIFENKNLFQF